MADASLESGRPQDKLIVVEEAIEVADLTVSGDNPASNEPASEPIAMHETAEPTFNISRDNFHDIIIQQVNNLKIKNMFNHKDLTKVRDEANRHLVECNDHHLQIVQYKFVFGAGNSRIHARLDGSIDYHNNEKIILATKVMEFEIKRVKSLGAFYAAQQRYFDLLRDMKEIEMEIKQLLASAVETGAAPDGFYDEMVETRGRIANMEESRVAMRES